MNATGPLGPTLRMAAASLPHGAGDTWRQGLGDRLDDGARVIALYGRRRRGDVELTAILHAVGDLTPVVSRTHLLAGDSYRELSSVYPALACFEREMHEQTGLAVPGHPWLKPIRGEGGDAHSMAGYPYWQLQGQEVHEVAVGPIHAGVIEPGSFRFQCLGERVHHLEIQLGYQHRGVEALLLKGDPRRQAPLVETIAGDASVAHAAAYCTAIEALADAVPPPEVQLARAFLLELERVAMHLASLAGLATDIGFLQAATSYGRLRTTAINTSMRLCGSRFGRGALRPGGIRLRMSDELREAVRANLRLMQHDVALVDALFLRARSVQHRLRGIGRLTAAQTRELGLVGIAARSADVPIDVRDGMVSGPYATAPLPPVVVQGGDCLARALVRIRELGTSLAWLLGQVDRLPDAIPPPLPIGTLRPSTLALAMIESWRGEVVHCVETAADGSLAHYKVQDPSLRNWLGLAIAVRGNEISDFPICNKSFDLSYCGNDL